MSTQENNKVPHIRAGIYRHYKNKKEYRVIGVARHTETDEYMVVYEPLYDSVWTKLCVRPYEMFVEEVTNPETGRRVERFEWVRE